MSASTATLRWRPLRLGPVSLRWHPRSLVVFSCAAATSMVLLVLSLGTGDVGLSPGRVIHVLAGGGNAYEHLVVMNLRLSRTLLGLLVGAMLGISGAIVQAATRNGLASPDLLGVTAGASAGAVAVIVLGGSTATGVLRYFGVPAAALLGGLSAALVVGLMLRRTGTSGLQPLLIGVGVSALFSGLTSWALIAADIDDAERANAWLTGSLNGRSWPEVTIAAITLLIVAVLLLPLASRLPTIELGHDLASSLGTRVGRVSASILVCAVALAAISAAVVGPVGFVALVAPHIARLACAAPRAPLAVSAATGAALVLASDVAGRAAFAPILLPAGAVTALVGAPFLIWLLLRSRTDAAL